MKRKMDNKRFKMDASLGRSGSVAMAGIALAMLGMTSCTTDDLAGLDNVLDQGYKHAGSLVPIPSDARRAVDAIRTLKAIAEYQASEKQLASARSKAKSAPQSSQRQYIRVKPDSKTTHAKTKGTHVVAYEPSTGKLDDEVVVVPDTDLAKGDSVSINGQSGKII